MFSNRPGLLTLAAFIVASFVAPPAWAHCDTISGPVAQAVRAAFQARDVRPVLKWVKADAEPEVRSAFEKAIAVRVQGTAARELADRYFLETVVRLHRAGEGAPYTGIKTEAEDAHGLIAASDGALDRGLPDALRALLTDKVAAGLRERYERVAEYRRHADESVAAGRRFVEAYVEYVHFMESLQNALTSGSHSQAGGHRHDQ